MKTNVSVDLASSRCSLCVNVISWADIIGAVNQLGRFSYFYPNTYTLIRLSGRRFSFPRPGRSMWRVRRGEELLTFGHGRPRDGGPPTLPHRVTTTTAVGAVRTGPVARREGDEVTTEPSAAGQPVRYREPPVQNRAHEEFFFCNFFTDFSLKSLVRFATATTTLTAATAR